MWVYSSVFDLRKFSRLHLELHTQGECLLAVFPNAKLCCCASCAAFLELLLPSLLANRFCGKALD